MEKQGERKEKPKGNRKIKGKNTEGREWPAILGSQITDGYHMGKKLFIA